MITVTKDIELVHPILGFISHVEGADPLIVVRPGLPDDQLWGVTLRLIEIYETGYRHWPEVLQVLLVEHRLEVHRLICCTAVTDYK